MDSFKDALFKNGFINENGNIIKKIKIPKLNKEEYSIFNKMLQDKKCRKFLLHIVHAFLPNLIENNINYIWSWNEVKGERRCAICEQQIISLNDAYVRAIGQIDNNLKRSNLIIKNDSYEIFESINKKLDEILFNLFLSKDKYFTAFNNKVPAIHSQKSQVFLCAPCYKLLNNWVAYMLKVRNRDIKFVVGNNIKTY
jgi:hypothetical protein